MPATETTQTSHFFSASSAPAEERAAFETCGVTANGRAGGEWRVVSQTDINSDDTPEYVLQRAVARRWHWVLVDADGHILRIAGDVRCADEE